VAGPPYEDLAFRIVNKVTVTQRERETDTQTHRQKIECVTKRLGKETMYVKRTLQYMHRDIRNGPTTTRHPRIVRCLDSKPYTLNPIT